MHLPGALWGWDSGREQGGGTGRASDRRKHVVLKPFSLCMTGNSSTLPRQPAFLATAAQSEHRSLCTSSAGPSPSRASCLPPGCPSVKGSNAAGWGREQGLQGFPALAALHFSSMPFTGHPTGIFLQPPGPSHPHSQRLGWQSCAMGCILFSEPT